MRATITLPDDVFKFVDAECAKINQTKSRYIAHLLKQAKNSFGPGVTLDMTPETGQILSVNESVGCNR